MDIHFIESMLGRCASISTWLKVVLFFFNNKKITLNVRKHILKLCNSELLVFKVIFCFSLQLLREERKAKRIAELLQNDEESEKLIQAAAVERSRQLDTTVQGKYSVWRREYSNPNSDSLLKLMKDQVIMAKAYASVARAKKENTLYNSLKICIKKNQNALGEALSDAELHPRYLFTQLQLSTI